MLAEVAMNRVVLVVVSLLAACGTSKGKGSNTGPLVTGDSCAVHQDATLCRADPQGCVWYSNTRPCLAGEPCPAGWCSLPQLLDGGTASDGGVSASAGCACPGAGGDACVTQIGGPAIQAEPPITCEAIPANCMLSDRCACLAQGTLEGCWLSDQVANLCICDNGIR